MPAPITRYRTSPQFVWAGLVALGITMFSAWVAFRWPYAWISAGLACATATLLLLLVFRPAIEIHEAHLKIGSRIIPWNQIRRLDRLCLVPLAVRLTLADKKIALLVHAGDPDSANGVLRHLRRYSREALIDGVPYRQFWGETAPAAQERKQASAKRYPLLLPDDEAEVERLFQRLKAVGHIEPKSNPKSPAPNASREDE